MDNNLKKTFDFQAKEQNFKYDSEMSRISSSVDGSVPK